MIRVWAALAASLLVGGCATIPPTGTEAAPVVVAGNWRIVAVNGRATPRSTRYNLRLGSHGEAQFGCNIGSGSYRASPGRLTPTSDWIITSAGCPGDEWKWFDRRGWPVMTRPTIVELRGRGLRLRNELGSLDLER